MATNTEVLPTHPRPLVVLLAGAIIVIYAVVLIEFASLVLR